MICPHAFYRHPLRTLGTESIHQRNRSRPTQQPIFPNKSKTTKVGEFQSLRQQSRLLRQSHKLFSQVCFLSWFAVSGKSHSQIMIQNNRDHALTKQCAFRLGKPLKSVFQRLNERLFSWTVWTFSRPFSIPLAARPSLPGATLHAAGADSAGAFRFSICSWRVYVSTIFKRTNKKL